MTVAPKPFYAESLTVRGFRGFRSDAHLDLAQPKGKPGSGMTIVVGANNTGKSTLWESFDAVARKMKGDVSFSEGRRNGGSTDGVSIKLKTVDGSSFHLRSRSASTSETLGDWSPSRPQIPLEIVSVPSRRQFDPSFSKHQNDQRDWMIGSQEFSRQRRSDGGFTGRLFALHNDDKKRAIFDRLMARVVGTPFNWSIDMAEGQSGQSYYLKVANDGNFHTSEGLGDGIISLLFILNAVFDSTPGTLVVLDEPELSLHPQLVRRLGDVLAEFAIDRQIVIFTHSPLLISWDHIENGARIARVHKVGGSSHVSQAREQTILEVCRARGGWRNPHVLGPVAVETLFLDDEIIIVEGQEDVALFPILYRDTQTEKRGNLFGWGSGGGDANPARIASLLNDLGFQKVVALLDSDKEDTAKQISSLHPHYLGLTIPAADIRDKPNGKAGLLDERGHAVHPQHLEALTKTLTKINEYFART